MNFAFKYYPTIYNTVDISYKYNLSANVMGWCVAAFNNGRTEKCWSSIVFYKLSVLWNEFIKPKNMKTL